MAYKFQEWNDGGVWRTASIPCEENRGARGKWWYPARKLNMSLIEYVDLIKKYGGEKFQYFPLQEDGSGDVLIFSFKDQTSAHKFVLYINRMARNNNW